MCAPLDPFAPTLSFAVQRGMCLALLGNRVSDMSCLMDTLAGHLPRLGGEILIDGQDRSMDAAGQRGIGLFSPRDHLFAHMTVRQNVAFPLMARGCDRSSIAARVNETLALTGLDGRAEHTPQALEPQEAWRARLARLLVFGPPVLLLDDPFAKLEPDDRSTLRQVLARLARAQSLTMLLATRDREDALLLGDRIGVLSGRTLLQTGRPVDLFDNPACAAVAADFGDANTLTGRVGTVEDDVARVHLANGCVVEARAAEGLAPDMLCTLCIRPDRIATLFPSGRATADPEEGTLPASLVALHHMGDHIRLRFRLGDGQEILVRRPPAQSLTGLEPGRPAQLAWPPVHAVAFPFRGEMS